MQVGWFGLLCRCRWAQSPRKVGCKICSSYLLVRECPDRNRPRVLLVGSSPTALLSLQWKNN